MINERRKFDTTKRRQTNQESVGFPKTEFDLRSKEIYHVRSIYQRATKEAEKQTLGHCQRLLLECATHNHFPAYAAIQSTCL
jgi:hypothetical protein